MISIAPSGAHFLQYPTRGSLRSPLAIYSRPSGADHGNTKVMGLQGVLQQPLPGVPTIMVISEAGADAVFRLNAIFYLIAFPTAKD